MRQKILIKNLRYSFWRIDKEKNIEIFNNGGWHFNNLMTPKNISLKIRTFAHSEYNKKCFFDQSIIKKKITERKDLFNRGKTYKKILIDKNNYPKFIYNSLNKFRNFIEK
jgi:beta-1,4-mannosyl-glycoprotein beta-1,4-N-acetylglucosaminyltransferase